MLADPRSETLATNFAMQWLRLTGIEEVHPEGTLFPEFTRNLARSMKREVELLFDTIVREDRVQLLRRTLWPRERATGPQFACSCDEAYTAGPAVNRVSSNTPRPPCGIESCPQIWQVMRKHVERHVPGRAVLAA